MHNPIKNMVWLKYPLGDITQYYGENPKLYSSVGLGLASHNGVDIVRPHGTHMYAIEDGIVCAVKTDAGGYGKHVRILSPKGLGKYHEWTYGHCDFIGVTIGKEVKAGQFIATMGNTGFVVSGNTPYWGTNPYAGTHLHLGLRRAKKSVSGWKYEDWDASPKIDILDYDNGNKGAIDPIPYFFPYPKAHRVRKIAEDQKSKVLYQLSEILLKIKI